MARHTREVQSVPFDPAFSETIVPYLDRLTVARDGWINLLPKLTDDDVSTTLSFFSLFGGGSSGATMCSWIAPHDDRQGHHHCEIGISHTTGKRAVGELASSGLSVPIGWAVVQDHPRRGLVLWVSESEAHDVVLSWMLRAAGTLNVEARTRRWLAEIHFPANN